MPQKPYYYIKKIDEKYKVFTASKHFDTSEENIIVIKFQSKDAAQLVADELNENK